MKNINDYRIEEELINEGLFSAIKRFFKWLFGAKDAETDDQNEILWKMDKKQQNIFHKNGVYFNKKHKNPDFSKLNIKSKEIQNLMYAADITKNINKVLSVTKTNNSNGFKKIFTAKKLIDKNKKFKVKYLGLFITNYNIAAIFQIVENYWKVSFKDDNKYSTFAHINFESQKYFSSGNNKWITYIWNDLKSLIHNNENLTGYTITVNSNEKSIINTLINNCGFKIDKQLNGKTDIILFNKLKSNNNNKENKENKDNNKDQINYATLDLTNKNILNNISLKESDENIKEHEILKNSIDYKNAITSYYDIYYNNKKLKTNEIACSILIEYNYWKNSKDKNEKYYNYANIKLVSAKKYVSGNNKWLEYLLMNIKNINTKYTDDENTEHEIEGLTINKNDDNNINKLISKYSFNLDTENNIFIWKNPNYKESEESDKNLNLKDIQTEKITEQLKTILKNNPEDFKLIKKLRSNRKIDKYDFYGIYNNDSSDKKIIGIYLIEYNYWKYFLEKNKDNYEEKDIKSIEKIQNYINIYIDIKNKFIDNSSDIFNNIYNIIINNNKNIDGITISEATDKLKNVLSENKFNEIIINDKVNNKLALYIKELNNEKDKDKKDTEEKDKKDTEEKDKKDTEEKDKKDTEEKDKLKITEDNITTGIKAENIPDNYSYIKSALNNDNKIINNDGTKIFEIKKDKITYGYFVNKYGIWKNMLIKIKHNKVKKSNESYNDNIYQLINEDNNIKHIKLAADEKTENIINLFKHYVNMYFEVSDDYKNNIKELLENAINYNINYKTKITNGITFINPQDNIKSTLKELKFNEKTISLKIRKSDNDESKNITFIVLHKSINLKKNESLSYIKKYTKSINEHLSIYDYYKYYKSINEELDENILWKLDKWFEMNEEQESEFIGILTAYKTNKNIKSLLKGTKLYDNIKEFVNFLNDDINSNNEIDYIYQFEKILSAVANNKSNTNKYFII